MKISFQRHGYASMATFWIPSQSTMLLDRAALYSPALHELEPFLQCFRVTTDIKGLRVAGHSFKVATFANDIVLSPWATHHASQRFERLSSPSPHWSHPLLLSDSMHETLFIYSRPPNTNSSELYFPPRMTANFLSDLKSADTAQVHTFFHNGTLLSQDAMATGLPSTSLSFWTYFQVRHFLHSLAYTSSVSRPLTPFECLCTKTSPQQDLISVTHNPLLQNTPSNTWKACVARERDL